MERMLSRYLAVKSEVMGAVWLEDIFWESSAQSI